MQLDEKLSPGQNAQRYFKLYQKARSAKRLAAEQVEKTTEELSYLEGQMLNLSACVEENDLAELREELEKYGYVRKNHNRRQMKQTGPSRPMRFDSPTGIPILVGKNNLQNDKLTFTAEPNEWWLHAKDMPGSHVIVASARSGRGNAAHGRPPRRPLFQGRERRQGACGHDPPPLCEKARRGQARFRPLHQSENRARRAVGG